MLLDATEFADTLQTAALFIKQIFLPNYAPSRTKVANRMGVLDALVRNSD